MKTLLINSVLAMLTLADRCPGAVVEYTNHFDPTAKANWQAAVGVYSTITFTELPANTWITTQYSHLEVSFIDGSDQVVFMPGAFLNDNYGLNGAFDETTIAFSQPMFAIAADFPGGIAIKLYYQDDWIYESDFLMPPPGGIGGFAGLVSDQPFDKVVINDPTGGLFIDDLHFGPPIPAPGAMVTMILALCASRSRRRRA